MLSFWKTRWNASFSAFAMLAAFGATPGFAAPSDPQLLKKQSSWNWPDSQTVLQQVDSYLKDKLSGKELADAKTAATDTNASRGVSLLDYILTTTAKVESGIESLKQLLDAPFTPESSAKIESQISSILANGSIPVWLKADLQLICCRYLVHHDLFDEALQRLQPLSPDSSSDPATWLFCMAVCQHHLMQRTDCLNTLDKLLERETELPTRYAITARLMQADIRPLKEDSLDEIARMMNDVERRLALGRAGKSVREKEQAIVDKLDKMIEKLEQQQQDQQEQQQKKNQGKSNGQNSQRGSNPMEESKNGGEKGPGEVDKKDIGDGSGWGNLPPAQRQEALQNMTKDLPSHYREVIEAYFKRLATKGP
jgi:hypothetical protein